MSVSWQYIESNLTYTQKRVGLWCLVPLSITNIPVICEHQRALYGIQCVLRIFLTNMASHTDG